MDEIFQIQLDKTSEVPMYRQLADAIGALAADGLLPADSKLPPIRKMAAHFGVNTVTVVTAYKYLEQKQMVYSRVGSGTYISPLPVEKVPEPVARRNLQLFEKHLRWNMPSTSHCHPCQTNCFLWMPSKSL